MQLQRCGPAYGFVSITFLSRKATKTKRGLANNTDSEVRLNIISVVFQNKGHSLDRVEEKLHSLAQAFSLFFSFLPHVTTANPDKQVLGVEKEIKMHFNHSKYFCWGVARVVKVDICWNCFK